MTEPRQRVGGWLTGVLTAKSESRFPGADLGLPERGSRSVASMGARVAALLVDWLLSLVIATAIYEVRLSGHSSARHLSMIDIMRTADVRLWALAIFAGQVYLFTALTGITIGKRLLRVRVARLDGKPVGLWWALVRTVLLLLVIPPLVTDGDLRGLHDQAANTVVIRL